MTKKTKLGIGILILLVGFGYLFLSGINNSSSYFLTIDEVLAEGDNIYGQRLKISGKLVEDSVEWKPEKLQLNFTIKEKDGDKTIPVRYHGVKPDNFHKGVTAVVQGEFTRQQYFKADKLMLKCPSKYEAEHPKRVDKNKSN